MERELEVLTGTHPPQAVSHLSNKMKHLQKPGGNWMFWTFWTF
jgi:hypothetical protein